MNCSEQISVIIPHKNDTKRLKICITLLLPQLREQDELVVVDNGSVDRNVVIAICREARVGFLECRHGGSYAARNLGINNTRSKCIVFTDSDCLPCEGFLDGYRKWFAMQTAEALAAGPIELVPKDVRRCNAWECIDIVYGMRQRDFALESKVAFTANLAVTRGAIEKWGAFDERLYSSGDTEFCKRIGGHVPCGLQWVEDAKILHPTRSTREEHMRRLKRQCQGMEHRRRIHLQYNNPQRNRSEWRLPSPLWRKLFKIKNASITTKLLAMFLLAEIKIQRICYNRRLRRMPDVSGEAIRYN